MDFLWVKNESNKALAFVAVSFVLLFNCQNSLIAPVDAKGGLHIVYIGEKQHHDPELVTSSHYELLASVVGSKEDAIDSMVYSYKHGFSGFAAKLTESQAKTIAGMIDTGIWPESKMLNDEGAGPIPTRWQGRCESGEQFNAAKDCNRKLIGAKWFIDGFLAGNEQPFNTTEFPEFLSPRDAMGHGTHTATTAAGSFVANVSYKGLGLGVVRGGAPRAHLSVYKACWYAPIAVCAAADVLKAIDEAIHDGVDVLSLSIGDYIPKFAEVDKRGLIATSSFHAVGKGITVVCAADNTGPSPHTVANVSPWNLTVAATTIDRSFPTGITLGNNITLLGQAKFAGKEIGFTGLVYPEGPEIFPTIAGTCESLSLNNTPVAGNVVLCFTAAAAPADVTSAISAVRRAGGVGLIIARHLEPCNDDFPCVVVDHEPNSVGQKDVDCNHNFAKVIPSPSVVMMLSFSKHYGVSAEKSFVPKPSCYLE